jgi:hypothetical protein
MWKLVIISVCICVYSLVINASEVTVKLSDDEHNKLVNDLAVIWLLMYYLFINLSFQTFLQHYDVTHGTLPSEKIIARYCYYWYQDLQVGEWIAMNAKTNTHPRTQNKSLPFARHRIAYVVAVRHFSIYARINYAHSTLLPLCNERMRGMRIDDMRRSRIATFIVSFIYNTWELLCVCCFGVMMIWGLFTSNKSKL